MGLEQAEAPVVSDSPEGPVLMGQASYKRAGSQALETELGSSIQSQAMLAGDKSEGSGRVEGTEAGEAGHQL